MKILILILLISSPTVCGGQEYCRYNKLKPGKVKSTKRRIDLKNMGVFIILNGTDIAAPNSIFPKGGNGTIWNSGLGVSYKKRLSGYDFLKIELSYLKKGSYYQFNTASGRNLFRLSYFEIPILWSHNLTDIEETIIIETGLAISYLFYSSKQIASYTADISDPQAANFKSFDFPWIISIKAPLKFKWEKNLEIGLRFSYSPLSIHKTYKTESIWMREDDGMHHMTYGVQLEHKF